MDSMRRLVHEIHRRSIWQVMSVYAVGGWFAFEIVQSLTEGLGLPDWFPGLAFVLLIIGFPMVLATAIVQEGIASPEPPAPRERAPVEGPREEDGGSLDRLFSWRNAVGGGVLAFALWGVIAAGWLIFRPDSVTPPASRDVHADDGRTTIAVLPFTSVRSDEDSESFRVGIHDALLTQLVKVGELRVTSRTSVLEYERTIKNITEIGEELGVDAIVQGGVQRAGDTVSVNVQLIDPASDEHLWAETYTRRLSTANLIGLQGEIVREVARTLRAVLSPTEELRIAEVPTESIEAYDYYLRGRANEASQGDNAALLEAEIMYERATELDPEFALAHVRLGIVHNALYWYAQDRTEARLRRSQASIERAFELKPDLPEGHLALARYYYQGRRDYERALAELDLAEQGQVNESELFTVRGAIERRLGRLEEAVRSFRRAFEMDPRSEGLAWDIANTLTALGEYAEADLYYDRAADISPARWTPYRRKAWNTLLWTGDLTAARRVLEDGDRNVSMDPISEQSWNWAEFELIAREPEAALRHAEAVGDNWVPTQNHHIHGHALIGEALFRMGQEQQARAHFESARTALETRLAELPDDAFVHQGLSWVHARLGESETAIESAQRAVSLLPLSVDALLAPDLLHNLAAVYTTAGRSGDAIEILEQLLRIPTRSLSRSLLELDPVWDSLREDPGFIALLGS
jgi:serine/threonine-protein kinase